MSLNRYVTLNDGNKIPQIGLGTWLSKPGEVANAVEHAVKSGYRHLDLAKVYGNQPEVAGALKKVIPSVVKREDLFITSKLWNNAHRADKVAVGLDDTLQELGLDYLDLYLIHWPAPFEFRDVNELFPKTASGEIAYDRETSLVDTWKAMIELKKSGKVKSIGVSNFTQEMLEGISKATGVVPAVNQIEAHPLLPQDDLLAYMNNKGIHVTAYSPLGNNLANQTKIVDYPAVKEIAKRANVDEAQVLVAWGVKRGYSVIPKSVTPSRIESNFQQIELSDSDYQAVTDLLKQGKHTRFNIAHTYETPWDINIFGEPEEQKAKYTVKIA